MEKRISELEAEVASLRAKLAEQERAHREVIANLAATIGHELLNPLSAVQTARYCLEQSRDEAAGADPRDGEYLKIIGEQVNTATRVIGNLLAFARNSELVRSACPVDRLVEAAIADAAIGAEVVVELGVSKDLPIPAWDWEAVVRALSNVLRNSAEAIGNAGTIRVRAREAGGDIAITIADDGDGIPLEHLAHVFTPAFTTKARQSGLGLAAVSAIVRRHAGRVHCESTVGAGTTVTLTMPLSTDRHVSPPAP